MEAYILVLIIFLFAWAAAYFICDHELLAPPSLMMMMLTIAVVLSMIGLGSWNQIMLSNEAVSCFAILAISIVLGAIVARGLLSRRTFDKSSGSYVLVNSFSEKVISISASRWIVLIGILLFGIITYSNELVALADMSGMSSADYFTKAKWVREHYNVTFSTEGLDSGVGFSGLASRMQQIIMFSGYAGALAVAACFWKKADKKSYIGPVIIVLIACSFALLKGSRGDIVHYVLALIIAVFAFKMSNTKSKAKTSKRFALFGVIIFVGVVVLFYFGGVLLRSTAANMIDYISFYFGCGIPSFSYILSEPLRDPSAWGSTTFSQLYISLYKYGIIDTAQANASYFVQLGSFRSNVFTGCYRYYIDFGYLGILVLGALATIIMSAFYYALKNPRNMWVLLFSLLALTHAADIIRDDFIFASFFSPTLVWYALEAALVSFVLMYKRSSSGSRHIRKVPLGAFKDKSNT